MLLLLLLWSSLNFVCRCGYIATVVVFAYPHILRFDEYLFPKYMLDEADRHIAHYVIRSLACLFSRPLETEIMAVVRLFAQQSAEKKSKYFNPMHTVTHICRTTTLPKICMSHTQSTGSESGTQTHTHVNSVRSSEIRAPPTTTTKTTTRPNRKGNKTGWSEAK